MTGKKKKATPLGTPRKEKKSSRSRSRIEKPPSDIKNKRAAREDPKKPLVRVESRKIVPPLPGDPRPDLPKKVHTGGAPAKPYQADRYVPWAQALARMGLNKKQIATKMGIGRTLLFEWNRDHKDFADALDAGRAEAAAKVENALFLRCTGYVIEETKIIGLPQKGPDGHVLQEPDPKTGTMKPIIAPDRVERVKKTVLPDVGAITFYLKNQKPEDWKDSKALTDGDGKPLVPKTTIMAVLGSEAFRKYDAEVRAEIAAKEIPK